MLPWIASGGFAFYPTGYPGAVDLAVRERGIQLLAAQYIPAGAIGFLKRLSVAPTMPAIMSDPWRGWAGAFQLPPEFADPLADQHRAPPRDGLWSTPYAWQGYFSDAPEGDPFRWLPRWEWFLTAIPGTLARARGARGAFDPADASTWYLALNYPVPQAAYPGGPPGEAVGLMTPQGFPVLPDGPLATHVLLQPDRTLLLWARWVQHGYVPQAYLSGGPLVPWEGIAPIHPIGPSVGQLHGYTQPVDRESTADNAAHGWGG